MNPIPAVGDAPPLTNLPPLTIRLAAPRGFCAGVDRAVKMVERALDKFGAPIYVRHEIVHNRFVVDSLAARGVVFVKELDEVPANGRVIFSAHGVPKTVPLDAAERQLIFFDATCPLVSKVHRGVEKYHSEGRHVVLIGHAGHPEVIGTMGQLPKGSITLIETEADVASLHFPADLPLAYATQTTLSVDETHAIIAALKARFPHIAEPMKEDICYATTNRQLAVKTLAAGCDGFWVIGAPNSSNSMRLVEVAQLAGCPKAQLVQRASDIDWEWLAGVGVLGLSAGASAPEVLIDEVLAAARQRFAVTVEEVTVVEETVEFHLPAALRR
ncbi:MAG: 4-hydroxy-3-methylbut-2-enyl diphosphate reductase [Holosporaceae bacterium]|jgi:4-hydroxy-3-methylbut-2-enyl diphosphate reductase